MSLILDALNRSRQDADSVPGLATQHYLEPDESSLPRWLQWLPWLALLCVVVMIGWLLIEKFGNPEPSKNRSEGAAAFQGSRAGIVQGRSSPDGLSVGPGSNTDAAATPPPPVLPLPKEMPRVPPRRWVSQQSELVAGPQRVSKSQPGMGSRPGLAVPPTAPPATDAAVARLYQGAAKPASAGSASPPTARTVAATRPQVRQDVPVPVSQSEEVAEQPVDIAEILSRAEQELGRPPLAEHPAPFLANLSQQTKDAIPTLMYKRHDYAGAGGSSVMINGKTIGTGASVAPGVRVDEILPSSVILSHQGTQFRLRALNSWINL